MLRKSVLVVLCTLLLGPAWSAFAGMDPDLAVYWPLDEGTGTVANDASGRGNNGDIATGPTWVTPGYLGRGALQFTGTGDVRGPHVAMDNRSFTIAMWVNPTLPASGSQIVFSTQSSSATGLNMHLRIGGPAATDSPTSGIRFGFYNIDLDSPANVLQSNSWYHLVFRYDFAAQQKTIFVNGAQVAQNASTPFLATSGVVCLGSWLGGSNFTGIVDDFQIYQRALTAPEVAKIMKGLADASLAGIPVPDDRATDVHQDAVLSWKAGETAVAHDVYFGKTFTDVNEASRTDAKGVLASQGQTTTDFDPEGLLEYGQTYYWRIDEVNGAPDNTVFKGGTWNFTAEPYAYPITGVTATASNQQPTSPAMRAVDGSGLNANDQHGIDMGQMWMTSGGLPAWIQFTFDKEYKLDEFWVWNANTALETYMGFGAKSVTVEYSTDGTTWTAVENVPQFAQGTGAPTYTANTTVDMGGVTAKYVKLTITAGWGGTGIVSLGEVRFFYVPAQAREPQPATATTGISVTTDLDWRPGRGATSHNVFIGTDSNSVRDGLVPAETVTDHGFTPADLTFATKYFWKVDEVGDATYAGDVWDFTTEEYAAIDNFEGYTDDEGSRIYESWVDGITNGNSGSTVGYMQAPFAERTVIHSGTQSMPLTYDNSISPFYSEADLTFDSPQDWTANGADTVSLWFQGVSPAFVQTASGSILMNGIGADIWGNSDQFRFAHKTLTGNGTMVARVHSVSNSDVWAKAGVMIRQGIEPGSVHAFMPLTASAGNGASFQRRLTIGGASTNSDAAATAIVTKPYWVKIERVGDAFSGYVSPDGVTWTQLGTTETIVMTGPVLIGLAVCSHNATVLTGVEFSDVKTTGNVTGDWQLADVGIEQQGGNSLEGLYLTVKDSAGKTATLANPDAIATGRTGWQQWKIPLSDLTAAGLKANSVKMITVGVGNRTSPKAGGTGKIYIDDIGYGRPLP